MVTPNDDFFFKVIIESITFTFEKYLLKKCFQAQWTMNKQQIHKKPRHKTNLVIFTSFLHHHNQHKHHEGNFYHQNEVIQISIPNCDHGMFLMTPTTLIIHFISIHEPIMSSLRQANVKRKHVVTSLHVVFAKPRVFMIY